MARPPIPGPVLKAQVDQGLADRITAWAYDRHLSRPEAIRRILLLGLDHPPTKTGRNPEHSPPKPAENPNTARKQVAPKPPAETPAVSGCPHPKDQLKRLSWGTLCQACGTRLR